MNRLDLATTFLHSLLLGLRQKFNVFCCISQTHLFTLSERALIMRFSMCNKKNTVRNSELQNNNNINFKLIIFFKNLLNFIYKRSFRSIKSLKKT
jgi:hypothetical protein